MNRKRLTTGGAPAFVASRGAGALRVLHARRRAASRRAPTRSRSTRRPRERASLKLGQQMIVAGSAPAKRYTIVGIVKFGGGAVLRRRGRRDPDAGRGPARRRRAGRFDQIDVAAQPGVTPGRAARPPPRGAAAHGRRAHRHRSRPPRTPPTSKSNLSFLRTFLLVFAYVVAGRRRVHHLQHLLDHRRPAHARVRAAAHARRLARPDHALGRLRRPAARRASARCSGCSGASRSRRRSTSCSRPSAPTCPTAARCSRRARSSSRCSSGIGVTVLAGLAPAMRATRVPPLAAMREGVEIPPRPLPTRAPLIAALPIARRGRRRSSTVVDRPAALAVVAARRWCAARRAAARCACGAAASARRATTASSRRSRARSARSSAGAGSPAAWRARTRSASPGAR